jgi:large subunit ribosomal protein L5
MVRLKEKYHSETVPALSQQYGIKNKMALPRLDKIVLNMGIGKAIENKRCLECAVRDLSLITGQRPVITKAKNSIAGFKLREGQEIGCKVTLRGDRMYEFLDRLITIVIPRIRDFRGVSDRSFDKGGSYTLGLQEQSIFPEVNLDNIEFYQGMNITFVMKNGSKEKSYDLLKLLGMPFRNK